MKRVLVLFVVAISVALAGLFFWLSTEQASFLSEQAREIEGRLREEIEQARQEGQDFLQGKPLAIEDARFHYLIKNGQVIRWSSNLVVPDPATVMETGIHWVAFSRGSYLSIASSTNDQWLISLVPLEERFRITNQYLKESLNERIFDSESIMPVPPEGVGAPVTFEGKVVFRLGQQELVRDFHDLSFYAALLSSLLFLLALLDGVYHLVRTHQYGAAILLWMLGGGGLRVLMVKVGFPRSWTAAPVFDPAVFASSAFNSSVGDLLLNSIYVLITSVLIYLLVPRLKLYRWLLQRRKHNRFWMATLFLILSFFGLLFPFLYFETIAHNSTITLDLTRSLTFDLVRWVTYTGILFGLASSFLFCHVFIRSAFLWLGRQRIGMFVLSALLAAGIFWVYAALLDRSYGITLILGVTLFTVFYFTGWYRYLARFSFLTFIYLIVFIVFISVQSALTVRNLATELNQESMHRFGSNFLVDHDVLGEYLLNEASVKISEDPFIQTRLTNPLLGKSSIRQKIRLYYLNSYFDRYQVEIHLFNSSGDPVDTQTSSSFASFILQYQQQAGQTGYRGIYFVDQLEAETTKGYVVVVPIYRSGRNVGYAAIVLTLKKVIPRNVYPQLLVDNRFAQDFNAREFSFAIFQRDSLISSSGDYDYQRHFPAPTSGEQVREESGIQHIIVDGDNERKAVISSPTYPWKNVVANFAFWVLVGVILIFLWLLIMSYYYYRKERKLNYATRIQIYVYLAFIIPLLAVSITTINWTSQSALLQLENDFGKKTRILAEGISSPLVSYLADSTDLSSFENDFSSACKFADVDASVYSPAGKLIATSQPLIFDNQILTKWINPNALLRARESTVSFTLEEHVGTLAYNSSYASLRSPQTGELIGILSVPFFDSANSLEVGRIAIFSNVVIIFVAILLFFTLLSFFATRWLTFPLQLITRSFSKMSLKEENRLLDWKTDDEIGLMIREYNRMVQNLNRNKIELARSQKESAWREMAQQVAHEIKNPLTPMKLTVQQLELTLRSGELSREKTTKAIETLLAQLEILNEIASSFSNFAKMPAPILHPLDVGEQVRKVEQLYQNHPLGSVRWLGERNSYIIRGDDQLLNRILSNLVLNGLQSGREGQQINVTLKTELVNSQVRIQVKDDGMGMEESVKERIFVPNFTTKKWGTGLGLAIVKQGVEQMGGTIQLSSQPGAGTTFLLEFPVAE